MARLRLILGDQLSLRMSSLKEYQDGDLILMAEVNEEATYVKHHKKKIAFIFSAMRHFSKALEEEGYTVRYHKLDGTDETSSLREAVRQTLKEQGPFDEVVITEPGEYRLKNAMDTEWSKSLNVKVQLRRDDRFIASLDEFDDWADGRKALRMEYFYRDMRRKTGLLMEGDKPVGGQWNYDSDNRKRLPQDIAIPQRAWIEPDQITKDVMALVEERFTDHFGDLEPFGYGVTAEDAQAHLDWFLEQALPNFGDYQDAMAKGESFLFHSLISLYLNVGLLDPLSVCQHAEKAYQDDKAPLNAVEGFIRQILGWREYVRGIYWHFMPDYLERNTLNADRALPDLYWGGPTRMTCLKDCVETTQKHAYAHHIQRLMVTGNFALLAGLDPKAVNDWYLLVYLDAFEWVEAPNTHGMALFADGGLMASKPYAASGAYIDRMSDYCSKCWYDVKKKNGQKACPFNYLYWNFLIENEDVLKGNPRLNMPYRNLSKFKDDKIQAIKEDSQRFFKALDKGEA